MDHEKDVQQREKEMYHEAKSAIKLLEKYISNLYSPEGLFKVFYEGFLPVPYLINQKKLYQNATCYVTAIKNGGIKVVDEDGNTVDTVDRYRKIINRIS